MRKLILVAILFFFFTCFSCGDCDECLPPECDNCKETISVFISPDGKEVFTQVLKPTFQSGVPIDKAFIQNSYLYRLGNDAENNCTISRTPINKVTNEKVFALKMNGASETCSGDGCSHCAFRDSGGCICKKISGTCNHTIVKNRDILRLF